MIEFIGDSLTAGYGNESEDINEGYRIETQNAAKTYALLPYIATLTGWELSEPSF